MHRKNRQSGIRSTARFYTAALLILGVVGAFCSPNASAQRSPRCNFDGQITEQSVQGWLKGAREANCGFISLDSPGGDMDAAMRLGREIRSLQLPVNIRRNGSCASACVLVYAGGVLRNPMGKIAIHRPYYSSGSESLTQTQKRFRRLETTVKSYLQEMNVSPQLYDAMMRIPPEDAYELSREEQRSFGMVGNDPVHMEHWEAGRVRDLGITRQEWMEKQRRTRDTCGDISLSAPTEENKARQQCWRRVFPEWFGG